MTAARRLLTFILLSLMATVVFAQSPQAQAPPRTTEAVTAETDNDATNPRALQLSLDGAVRTSIERNLGVEVQRYESRVATENLRGQYGLFDWYTSANLSQSSSEDPTISLYAAGGSRATRANFGINQIIPTGGRYEVGWTNSRLKTTGGGTFVNPAYRSGLQFAFTQPLLRDFGIDVTRRNIDIARNTLGLSNEAFRTVLMNTSTAVEQAYLDLVYARRNVEVVKEALFLARDQSRITQIRIDVGASAPLDILQPRVQIATTEETLIGAVASVRNAEDRLRALLNLPQEEWNRPIVPVDKVAYQPMSIDTEAAVAQALQLRPELRQLDITADTQRIQQLYARNQMLPTVDFGLGYGLNGLAGRTIELDNNGNPTGGFRSTGYSDTLSQLFGNDFPSWNVGFTIGVPITNIGARAAARAAELDLQQTRVDKERVRQDIAKEVRAAARAVDTYARAIGASTAARDAAEKNVEAERKRFENGLSTNFQVLQVQQQLSDARRSELQAIVGYNAAVSAFHRAVGDILDVRNIKVEQDAPNEPKMFSWFDRYPWMNYGKHVKGEQK